jgi:hypothetical protein
MAIFMTSSLMGLVGLELIGIAISRRIYRGAACVQRGGGRLDPMAMRRKFGDLAVNLGAVGSTGVDQGLVRLVDAQLAQKSRTLAAPGKRIADGGLMNPLDRTDLIKGMQNEQDITGGFGNCRGGVSAEHGQRRD